MQIADIQSGSFFKAEEYTKYDALLLEVTGFERGRPSNYGPKDTAHVDITGFIGGEKVHTAQGVMIQQTLLARDLAPIEGKATIQKLEKGTSSKPGQNAPWVWRKPAQEAYDAVIAYVQERTAAEKAAMDSAPGF